MQLPAGHNEGLPRFSGLYGTAWRAGVHLFDVVEVSGAVESAVIDVPLSGTIDMGYKPGRRTREGTLRVQKVDSRWEWNVSGLLGMTLAEMYAARDAGLPMIETFDLTLKYDDPYALGVEAMTLHGVMIFRFPIGFSNADDLVDREFPIRWASETWLDAFKVSRVNGVLTSTPLVKTQFGGAWEW